MRPPSPSNSNLNAAMLMYNLFGANPVTQSPGLPSHHPALTPHADPHQLLHDLSRSSSAPMPMAPKPQYNAPLSAAAPAAAPPLTTLQPALYEVPTAHLLFFMNLIPQKDREIAQIMRHKELEQAKVKRKDDSHEKKRKRKSKEEATITATKKNKSGTSKATSNGNGNSRSRRSTSFDDEYIDLGLVENDDDEIINTWSTRRRGAAGQKKSDIEWEKVKELAAAERSVKRKKPSGSASNSASNSRQHKTEPVDVEPTKPKEISPSKRSRKGRATERDDEGSLFCICRSPEEYGFMIACDKCNEWFHGGCVGLTPVLTTCETARSLFLQPPFRANELTCHVLGDVAFRRRARI
jgi:hypothetical protein